MGDKPKDTLSSPLVGKRKEITPTNTPPQQQKAKTTTSHETPSTPTKTTPTTPTTPTPLGAVANGLRSMFGGRIVNATKERKGGVTMTVNRSVRESDLEKIIASPTEITNQRTVTTSTQLSQTATISKSTTTKKCGYCTNGCTSPCSVWPTLVGTMHVQHVPRMLQNRREP